MAKNPLAEKVKLLKNLKQIKSIISPNEFHRLRVEILGDTADDEPFIFADAQRYYPLLQLLDLLIHVSKSGRRFHGVDVILLIRQLLSFQPVHCMRH